MDGEPEIGGREPITVEVEAGKSYWWCTCGRSDNQPFCAGKHKETGFTPMEWKSERKRRVKFCTCKRTKRPPFCDDSHLTL